MLNPSSPLDSAPLAFSALLLAGGRSRRMGRDKAALQLHGLTLRERGCRLLRSLGPAQLFYSGPQPPPETLPVADWQPDCGPLGGLVAALHACTAPRLLVMAVDLPHMPAEYLRALLAAHPGGVIPHGPDGYEPLAAIYPRQAFPLALHALERGALRLQALAGELIAQGLATPHPISAREAPFFRNVNTPAEWVDTPGADHG